MFRGALTRPLPLLLFVTALFTFLIQSGELGTSDTTHRLQVTHSLWTGEPQVFPDEYPDFGVHGRGGRLYATYGIGQSLLMLPGDLAGTAASYLPLWRSYVNSQTDPMIRSIFVTISTNILVNVLTALVAYRLLGLLGFSVAESVAGTLGLLCATTHLHYAQDMTENNYILLLTIAGLYLQYKWLVTADRRSLFWGSAALGFNLLTRITTALDIVGAACFLLLAAKFAPVEARQGTDTGASRLHTYLRTALPVYAVFFFLDRLYQYVRFGSWSDTYVAVLAREARQRDPSLPSNFPFDGHWFRGGLDSGVIGPLFSPSKSIFLFDPMLVLMVLLAVLLWRRLAAGVRAVVLASLALVALYVIFYARYDSWAGDYAWGDRYVSSAVELASLLALPLVLRYRDALPRGVWSFGLVVTVWSFAVQCASLAFWLPLEIYQGQTFGGHTWVVFLRFKNIVAFLLGRRDAWGLNSPSMNQDPWDAAHLGAWNFLPSLLRHIGVAPMWVVYVLDCVWFAVALVLAVVLVRLVRILLRQPVDKECLGGVAEYPAQG